MIIPLGPPVNVAFTTAALTEAGVKFVSSAMQPEATVPVIEVQSCVRPKKKKSVPPAPMLGLKNSVHPLQRAAVEVESCCLNNGASFMSVPLNPKPY